MLTIVTDSGKQKTYSLHFSVGQMAIICWVLSISKHIYMLSVEW